MKLDQSLAAHSTAVSGRAISTPSAKQPVSNHSQSISSSVDAEKILSAKDRLFPKTYPTRSSTSGSLTDAPTGKPHYKNAIARGDDANQKSPSLNSPSSQLSTIKLKEKTATQSFSHEEHDDDAISCDHSTETVPTSNVNPWGCDHSEATAPISNVSHTKPNPTANDRELHPYCEVLENTHESLIEGLKIIPQLSSKFMKIFSIKDD